MLGAAVAVFAGIRGCSRGLGSQRDRNGGRKGPQKDRKVVSGARFRRTSVCRMDLGLFESFHLSFWGFSTVARCGVLPGEDDRLREENETLIDGAAVSIGVRPMLML
jgi:hypothetical protein